MSLRHRQSLWMLELTRSLKPLEVVQMTRQADKRQVVTSPGEKWLVEIEESLIKEETAFLEKREELFQHYDGEFVVFYQGDLVGHGKDDEELARQMFEALGDVPFYIVRIEKEPSVYELPSPEVVD